MIVLFQFGQYYLALYCASGYCFCNYCRFGDTSLQETINDENFSYLTFYYEKFREKFTEEGQFLCSNHNLIIPLVIKQYISHILSLSFVRWLVHSPSALSYFLLVCLIVNFISRHVL